MMKDPNRHSGHRRNAREDKDIVRKEIQKLGDELERSERKSKKRKKRCQDQAKQIKMLEHKVQQKEKELEHERKESARRVLHARIQAHLDALAFYRGDEVE